MRHTVLPVLRSIAVRYLSGAAIKTFPKPRREEETGDWRQFFQHNDNVKFKGEEPNFEEEGWARRRPKKK